MLENIFEIEELITLAGHRKRAVEYKTVPKKKREEEEAGGWSLYRRNKKSYRLVRPKGKDILLEDRVWTLFYKMNFTHLSGVGGGSLKVNPKESDSPKNQIDVVALDEDLALAIECKSADMPRRARTFQKDLAKHSILRERFARAVHPQFPSDHKRVPALAFFVWDLILSSNDKARAHEQKVAIFDESDLDYYEKLVEHIGPAARYQFFADILEGKPIHGLNISVPALKIKIGKMSCYTFSISPEYLLKISYVSHRAKGHATDVDTYQRMIKKTRLKRIKAYISDKGVFPTNIVINIDKKKHIRFDKGKQDTINSKAIYGTLTLSPSYKSAWIIDGQHRLYAYSGMEEARTSFLNVLAFEGLPTSLQAKFFIDINHEQKSVKRNLLHELYAELNWDSEDEGKRIGSIVSKSILAVDSTSESPFFNRIFLSDSQRTNQRCITLEGLFKALTSPGMVVSDPGVEYGPLWAGDNRKTLNRIITVTNGWIDSIRQGGAKEWWDLGAAQGGGLAMNDGIAVCFGLLKSVFQHLTDQGRKLLSLSDEELVEVISPFGIAAGKYMGSLTDEQRLAFRSSIRGVQGQTKGRRIFEKALSESFAAFKPTGLESDLLEMSHEINKAGYAIINNVEDLLWPFVYARLTGHFTDNPDDWWFEGVPRRVRDRANAEFEEAKGRKSRESYVDFEGIRQIVKQNWLLFENELSSGDSGNKDKKIAWLIELNSIRNDTMHPGGRGITQDELQKLQNIWEWLSGQIEVLASVSAD